MDNVHPHVTLVKVLISLFSWKYYGIVHSSSQQFLVHFVTQLVKHIFKFRLLPFFYHPRGYVAPCNCLTEIRVNYVISGRHKDKYEITKCDLKHQQTKQIDR
ncbi:hypothetical protein BpHYR1_041996 [Brachionus plicatilis]|uniref:Uncharacterized protein n=1 Tax=Brachionus plicatilis TaxID=10195 RepID=A0A3M7R3A8_BRAPC|nr:hypothetical protein BpHYR1_041996 [Brachionus plicatilis]